MLAALLLLGAVSYAAESALERTIECSAVLNKQAIQLKIDSKELVVSSETNEGRLPVLSSKVEGKGARARKVVKVEGGEISFKEVYGCLKDAKGTLEGTKLQNVKCKDPSGPACEAGVSASKPKADK